MELNAPFLQRTVRSVPTTDRLHRAITDRAQSIWQRRGRPRHLDLSIWLEAERQLVAATESPALDLRTRLRAGYAEGDGRRSPTSL